LAKWRQPLFDQISEWPASQATTYNTNRYAAMTYNSKRITLSVPRFIIPANLVYVNFFARRTQRLPQCMAIARLWGGYSANPLFFRGKLTSQAKQVTDIGCYQRLTALAVTFTMMSFRILQLFSGVNDLWLSQNANTPTLGLASGVHTMLSEPRH